MRGWLQGIGILMFLCLSGCGRETTTEEVEVGFRGLAANNPFLGAQRLAEELGYEGKGTVLLSEMPPLDWAMLLRPGVMTGGEAQAYDLLTWVASGGDLWVDLEDYLLEEDEIPGELEDGPAQWALYTLIDELGLEVVYNEGYKGEDEDDSGLNSAPGLFIPWPETDLVLGDASDRAWEYWGDSSHAAMVHMPWGDGSLHFFASLEGFDNDHLPDHNWAEIFEHLMANANGDRDTAGLLVVYGGSRSFMAMLWQHAWFFLVAMGLLTTVWIWRVSRRFGPVLEDPAWDPDGVGIGGGREFVEHLVAAGRTYERRGQLPHLFKGAWSHAHSQYFEGDPAAEAIPEPGHYGSIATPFLNSIQDLQDCAQRGSAGQRTPAVQTASNPEKDNDQ